MKRTKKPIKIKLIPSAIKYGIISNTKEAKKSNFFPGFKKNFSIKTDIGSLEARVSSASKATKIGSKGVGNYITGFGRYFKAHPELRAGDDLIIHKIGDNYIITTKEKRKPKIEESQRAIKITRTRERKPLEETVEVPLYKAKRAITPSWREYFLIPVTRDIRDFFPGYKVEFELETDAGPIITHVTSAPKGTKIGDNNAGNYIAQGMRKLYNKHPELESGDKLIIEKGNGRYRIISIVKKLLK